MKNKENARQITEQKHLPDTRPKEVFERFYDSVLSYHDPLKSELIFQTC